MNVQMLTFGPHVRTARERWTYAYRALRLAVRCERNQYSDCRNANGTVDRAWREDGIVIRESVALPFASRACYRARDIYPARYVTDNIPAANRADLIFMLSGFQSAKVSTAARRAVVQLLRPYPPVPLP